MPEKELVPIHNGRMEIRDEWRRMIEGTRRLMLSYWLQEDEPKDEIKTILWKPKNPNDVPADALFANYLLEFIDSIDDWRDQFKLQNRIFAHTSRVNVDKEKGELFLPPHLMTILGRKRKSLKSCLQTRTPFPDAFYLYFKSKTPFQGELAKESAIRNSNDMGDYIDHKIVKETPVIQPPPNLIILPEAS